MYENEIKEKLENVLKKRVLSFNMESGNIDECVNEILILICNEYGCRFSSMPHPDYLNNSGNIHHRPCKVCNRYCDDSSCKDAREKYPNVKNCCIP